MATSSASSSKLTSDAPYESVSDEGSLRPFLFDVFVRVDVLGRPTGVGVFLPPPPAGATGAALGMGAKFNFPAPPVLVPAGDLPLPLPAPFPPLPPTFPALPAPTVVPAPRRGRAVTVNGVLAPFLLGTLNGLEIASYPVPMNLIPNRVWDEANTRGYCVPGLNWF